MGLAPRSRRDVLRALRDLGLAEIREGGRYTIWGSESPRRRIPIGRHRELNGTVIRVIADELGDLGDEFLRRLGLK